MRFLLVVKQQRNVDAFVEALRLLAGRGHSVTLAVQDADDRRNDRLSAAIDAAGIAIVRCPAVRTDAWRDVATLLRRLRDCLQYLRPEMRQAVKLRARVFDRLRQDLMFDAETHAAVAGLMAIPPEQTRRLDAALALAEQALPTDPLFDEFLATHAPDVLLVSPLVHFGPAQADLVASARRVGIPAWMLLYSWDNLSTKGAIHRWPDRMVVWNDRQRAEAGMLHGFPAERVTVVGAPRFDAFFALQPAMSGAQFHEPLGLDPAKPTLLYVCSSRLVSEEELPFITRWIRALRHSASNSVRDCNIIVRPHPDIALLPAGIPMLRHEWPAAPGLRARIARPFDDGRAIVLMTPHETPLGLFESITHSVAVVGLNTTAELEAGIVGRPVFTIVADAHDADGQSSTMHFHYLTAAAGGFVSSAAGFEEHVAQLDAMLQKGPDPAPIRAFIQSFLRPHGVERPVAPILADVLEHGAGATPVADAVPGSSATIAIESADAARAGNRRPTLPLAYAITPPLCVYATRTTERMAAGGTIAVDLAVASWIEREIGLGEVLYDIGAGVGEYTLIAAKRRGAVVLAFEPGYAAHGELCENLLLNGCEASVVPIPLALAGRDGLAEIKYLHGQPGETGSVVRDDIDWRVKHRGPNKPYLQPALLARLDTLVERQGLPSPHHVRLAPHVAVAAVIAGASATLRLPSLKTICVTPGTEQDAAALLQLQTRGWAQATGAQASLGTVTLFRRHL